MKKSLIAIIAVLIVLVTLAAVGCQSNKGAPAATQRPVNDKRDDNVKTTVAPVPNEMSGELRPANKDTYVVKSEDGFKEYGFTCFIAGADSEYSVTFDTDDGAVEWKVYVLDEKFNDGLRYLPQAHEPDLTESGQLRVTKGQYVYVQCSASSFSATEPYEGASVTFTGAGLPKE